LAMAAAGQLMHSCNIVFFLNQPDQPVARSPEAKNARAMSVLNPPNPC
jgi:hypothetical protein